MEQCASHPSTLDHMSLVFRYIERPNVAMWRLMIRGYASDVNPFKSLSYFRDMQWTKQNAFLEPFICASVIKACGRLKAIPEGKSVHCQVIRLGLDSNVNIPNTLIHFYSNSSSLLSSSRVLFDGIPHRTIVTVNCMISGFMKNKLLDLGLSLLNQALDGSLDLEVKPNDVTLVLLISGCAEFGDLGVGTSLHCYCCKTSLSVEMRICNALINMYAKFGRIYEAAMLFKEMPWKDLFSWNTMISGYVVNNNCGKALTLFREMRVRGVEGDGVTLISLISACSQGRDLDAGKRIHAYMKTSGIGTTVPVGTALIHMYSKCGLIEFARKVFDELSGKNIVSWNCMISGYIECGHFREAFWLFDMIQCEKLKPDEVTMLGLISACRNSGELNHGIHVHSYAEKSGLHEKTVVGNALIDMYAKCGSMSRAKRVFDKMLERDVISWTSIIVGHAINGEGEEALIAFQQMCASRIEPNAVTFIGVLSACNHAGLVDDGRRMYGIMCKVYSIKPMIEHSGCMVDMFARAGMLEEAQEFVKNMSVEPNAVIWRMLVSGCSVKGDVDLGLSLVNKLIGLKRLHAPEDFVISSKIFAEAGRWDDVLCARSLMVDNQILKRPGKSSIAGAYEPLDELCS
ncbi:pentatricopeptide repeat-containing protein DOT4, chloroplastic-like [Telopea speciosissima]|uniref:pentatricopeptide repeat-containing protein DOT4, chloroplastic-like n=1 Tax=Telopea speciosissima TaxID=54955 RepID=UPI001CC371D2|nr:pentatricopeptide repeat-containing protein DOT4, chloroplastic-like [Telopea speciosissima]